MGELPTGTVTFLFTDIEGSTRLWEQHPEAMRDALARHDALLRERIESHGGSVFKTVGDQFCAAFPTAPTALRAALEAQRSLQDEPWPLPSPCRGGAGGGVGPLRVRMALHTGSAQEREGDYFGPTLNRVARLLEAGHGGQILLSLNTAELTRDHLPAAVSLRDLGSHRLKDLQQPEHLYQLLHPALPGDFPPLRSLEAFAHNLPRQLTSFVGREKERTEVKQFLATTSLLTLTGSGGCGKTRLALQVAAEVLEEYADGVWLVELAPLADATLVPQTVAAALGVREEPNWPLLATLSDYLRPRSLLLVLDNCEHLLTACAQLADTLLRACPHLRILASSREGLGISGEQTYRVPSLSLPDPRQLPPPERLRQFEAVQLFADRAGLAQPRFAVTAANAVSVAQVCQRLDGIPLAIELAAARLKALPVEQIVARLDDRFRLLTGGSRTALPRQQTLRALIDWSYDLLSEPERTLLRRLSVFSGGWTLEAAEAVCSGEAIGCQPSAVGEDRPVLADGRQPTADSPLDVLDRLTTLVEKSLVIYEEREGAGGAEGALWGPDPGRYRLLETVRQYARDRLLETGEAERMRGQHRDFFLRFAEEAEPKLRSEQAEWLERLERDYDNLRTALEWCKAGDNGAEAGLRLANALGGFWWMRGHLSEGREQLADLLSRTEALEPTAARAMALNWYARLVRLFGDYAGARTLYEEALTIERTLGDKGGIAYSLNALGVVPLWAGDYASARPLLEESLAIYRELGDEYGAAGVLGNLGSLAYFQGDYGEARALLEESVAFFRKANNRVSTSAFVHYLGHVARAEGNYPLARRLYEEGLAVVREVGHRFGMAGVVSAFGQLAAAEGQPARAARLMGAAEVLREALHMPVPNCLQADHDRGVAAARAALGEEAFTAAWAEGRAMTLEQTIGLALQKDADA